MPTPAGRGLRSRPDSSPSSPCHPPSPLASPGRVAAGAAARRGVGFQVGGAGGDGGEWCMGEAWGEATRRRAGHARAWRQRAGPCGCPSRVLASHPAHASWHTDHGCQSVTATVARPSRWSPPLLLAVTAVAREGGGEHAAEDDEQSRCQCVGLTRSRPSRRRATRSRLILNSDSILGRRRREEAWMRRAGGEKESGGPGQLRAGRGTD